MRRKRAWEAIAIRASQPHARQSDCRESRDGVRTYGGGGDGDGGSDVGGVESVVGDDMFGKEPEDEEDEEDEDEVVVSQDASEIIEGLIRNGLGRRETTKTCFGDVPGMIQGTDVSSKLGNRECVIERCGDHGGELGCW